MTDQTVIMKKDPTALFEALQLYYRLLDTTRCRNFEDVFCDFIEFFGAEKPGLRRRLKDLTCRGEWDGEKYKNRVLRKESLKKATQQARRSDYVDETAQNPGQYGPGTEQRSETGRYSPMVLQATALERACTHPTIQNERSRNHPPDDSNTGQVENAGSHYPGENSTKPAGSIGSYVFDNSITDPVENTVDPPPDDSNTEAVESVELRPGFTSTVPEENNELVSWQPLDGIDVSSRGRQQNASEQDEVESDSHPDVPDDGQISENTTLVCKASLLLKGDANNAKDTYA